VAFKISKVGQTMCHGCEAKCCTQIYMIKVVGFADCT
jgi:hypothetical protein